MADMLLNAHVYHLMVLQYIQISKVLATCQTLIVPDTGVGTNVAVEVTERGECLVTVLALYVWLEDIRIFMKFIRI